MAVRVYLCCSGGCRSRWDWADTHAGRLLRLPHTWELQGAVESGVEGRWML